MAMNMKMCEYANNLADMAFMIKLLIKNEHIYFIDKTTETMYSIFLFPLLNFDEQISLPFYYQKLQRNLYLVMSYGGSYFSIKRNIPTKEIRIIFG
jgi:hypothetical protein